MRRREFIALVSGAAAAWPLAVRAQQRPMPAAGFLDVRSPEAMGDRIGALRQGLRETGFVEGENISIDYRWAENRPERLPELAADLVRLKPGVIVTTGPPAAFAAKAATTTIPILFVVADDPVGLGLVASLDHPGGCDVVDQQRASLNEHSSKQFFAALPGNADQDDAGAIKRQTI
jgi:putative ABC transport system substrate-binding protein